MFVKLIVSYLLRSSDLLVLLSVLELTGTSFFTVLKAFMELESINRKSTKHSKIDSRESILSNFLHVS
uniref:Uncharacterized protein n=1 Tax=Rhizophagus irregularis (strain DAOM 181602 / DAOM 197198 / MUCL 43194) TaxID=747089 RepID=U9U641_RHIID